MTDLNPHEVFARLARLLRSPKHRRAFVHKRMHHWRARRSAFANVMMLRARRAMHGNQILIAIGLVEHMGDIVAAEPILRQVRRDQPSAHIIWFVREPFLELLELSPDLSQVRVVSCLTEWIYLRRSRVFDKVVDLHVQGRQCPICRIALRRPEGNQAITYDNYYHFGSLLDVMAQYTDIVVTDPQPRLETPPQVRATVDQRALPANFVVIHCTANEAARNWSVAGWRAIAEGLRAVTDLEVIEVGLEPVVAGIESASVIDLCAVLTLPEMTDVIRRATLFVGIDSGPAHVANAVGTPGVILLGSYRGFGRYMPYSGDYQSGANATVLYEPSGLRHLAPATVIAAIRQRLALPKAPKRMVE